MKNIVFVTSVLLSIVESFAVSSLFYNYLRHRVRQTALLDAANVLSEFAAYLLQDGQFKSCQYMIFAQAPILFEYLKGVSPRKRQQFLEQLPVRLRNLFETALRLSI